VSIATEDTAKAKDGAMITINAKAWPLAAGNGRSIASRQIPVHAFGIRNHCPSSVTG
jgi:hypothetical protein